MDATLRESSNGRVLVAKQAAPLLVRALGLPFLALGGYIGYYFLTGLIEYIRHATTGEWLEGLPVFILMAIFSALFFLPGMLLSFGAGVRVVMDRSAASVTSREGLMPWSAKQVLKFEELAEVVMRSEERRTSERSSATGMSSTRSTWLLNVYLQCRDDSRRALLGTFLAGEKAEADRFANRVADWIGVEFVDED